MIGSPALKCLTVCLNEMAAWDNYLKLSEAAELEDGVSGFCGGWKFAATDTKAVMLCGGTGAEGACFSMSHLSMLEDSPS